MGHIQLASARSVTLVSKGIPSRLGYLLDIPLKDLERVLYFEAYAVIDAGDTPLKEKKRSSGRTKYREYKLELRRALQGHDGCRGDQGNCSKIVDIEALAIELRHNIESETSFQKRLKTRQAPQGGRKPSSAAATSPSGFSWTWSPCFRPRFAPWSPWTAVATPLQISMIFIVASSTATTA